MKKVWIGVAGSLLVLLALAGFAYKSRPTTEFASKYPPMAVQQLVASADVIVEGTVIKRGSSQRTKIPTVDGSGKIAEYPETPLEIQVTDAIKGARVGETVTYFEPGGDFATVKLVPDGGALQVGEKVIIFLNKSGRSWGEQGIYRVKESKAVRHNKPPVDLAAFKESLRVDRR